VEAAVGEAVLDGTNRSIAASMGEAAVLLRRRLGRPSWLKVGGSIIFVCVCYLGSLRPNVTFCKTKLSFAQKIYQALL
jgi:hypothetical protein